MQSRSATAHGATSKSINGCAVRDDPLLKINALPLRCINSPAFLVFANNHLCPSTVKIDDMAEDYVLDRGSAEPQRSLTSLNE